MCSQYLVHKEGEVCSGRERTAPVLRPQIDVRLRPTNTVPSFLMPFTDPTLDVDVSGQMAGHAAVEMGLTQVLHALGFSGVITSDTRWQPTVLDHIMIRRICRSIMG